MTTALVVIAYLAIAAIGIGYLRHELRRDEFEAAHRREAALAALEQMHEREQGS